MRTSLKRLAAIFTLLLVLILPACNFPGLETKPPSESRLNSVRVTSIEPPYDFFVELGFYHQVGDQDYRITCTVPDEKGMANTISRGDFSWYGTDSFNIKVKKPGNYAVNCTDGRYSASALFSVAEEQSNTGETDPALKPSGEDGSFTIPKPGDFATAGMWMYFEKGTSSLEGYGVPQQCLPGVNYTHAGGTSAFDIDPTGKITGACYLEYGGGVARLSGTLTGNWDGKTNQITFRLETQTETDVTSFGKSATFINQTVFTGTAEFNSAVQASGTADWSTECSVTDVTVTQCGNAPNQASLAAEGTVPFVINFNAKP
jgi:hypothetical protein